MKTMSQNIKLTNDRAAAVDQGYFWQPMNTCPLNTKVQLYGGGGVAYYGPFNGHDNWPVGWAPLPKVPDWMTQKTQETALIEMLATQAMALGALTYDMAVEVAESFLAGVGALLSAGALSETNKVENQCTLYS